MSFADVVSAGRNALDLVVDCVRDLWQRAQVQLQPFLHGLPPEPPASEQDRSGAQGPHEAVEATKFFATAPVPQPVRGADASQLPRAYGVNRAVVTSRDPCCLFVWWEITPVSRVEALRGLGSDAEGAIEVLRVHRGEPPARRHVADIPLTPGAERWYVEVEPDDVWQIEIGLRTAYGRFVVLVSSNSVVSPPAQPSTDTSVRWVTVGRQGAAPATPEWSGQWVESGARVASASSDVLPFR